VDIINYILFSIILLDIALAYLIYSRGKKKIVNITYSVVILSVIIWTASIVFYRLATNSESTLFWARFLYAAASFTASTFFFFSHVFPYQKPKLSSARIAIVLAVNLIIVVASFTPGMIISSVEIPLNAEKIIHWGPLYYLLYIPYVPE
jgi:hypothetical protein